MKAAAALLVLAAVAEGSLTGNLRGGHEPRSLVASTRINPRGISYPDFRYVPWCSLNEKAQALALDLSWDSETWDAPGTATFESKSSFESMVEKSNKKNDTIAPSLISMGWTEAVYDCYVNHYEDYDWSDLVKFTDAVPFWVQLGWNSSSWDEEIQFTPDTEDMDWEELSEEQKAAAIALCYFEEIWSGIEIPSWSEFLHADMCSIANDTVAFNSSTAMASPSDLGIMEEEMLDAPIDAEGEDEMEEPDIDEELAAETVDEEDEGESFSSAVSGSASSPFSVQIVPTNPPVDAPADAPDDPDEFGVKYVPNPSNRFLLWSWLFQRTQEAATTLGFNETTWNQPMSASIESMTFDDLSTDQIEASYVLGFAPAEIWDCHINHYTAYEWDELATAQVQKHYITLGWSFESWSNLRAPPETLGSLWERLTGEEMAAARALCYQEPTWNRKNLNEWVL